MDWLDEKLSNFKDKLKMKSLRKTLSIYISISIIAVIVLYIVTLMFCNGWSVIVYEKYGYDPHNNIAFDSLKSVTNADKDIIRIINFVENYSVLLYSVIAILVTSNMFYKNKFKEPLEILKLEASYISKNDLSFSCAYNSGDEMGEICDAFDKMRLQISKNNENVWSLIDSQRQVNAAFAHDIRTPLTVMQGYVELLIKYYPEEKISNEKLMTTLILIQQQVERLKDFSGRMKGIHEIEGMNVKLKFNNLKVLENKIQELINGLRVNSSIEMETESKYIIDKGYFDEGIIMQVVENLLSNALSYTTTRIDITIDTNEDFLNIYIRDDGKGFSKEDLYYGTTPYYSSRKDMEGHCGMGLSICNILCEKHGGRLTLNNSTKGGAIVAVSFSLS